MHAAPVFDRQPAPRSASRAPARHSRPSPRRRFRLKHPLVDGIGLGAALGALGTAVVGSSLAGAPGVPHVRMPAYTGPAQASADGMSLHAVRPQEPAVYTVRPGDTLSGIAAAHGIRDWRLLWAANFSRVPDPDEIFAGQELTLSGGVLTAQMQAVLARVLDPAPPPAPAMAAPAAISGSGVLSVSGLSGGESAFQGCVIQAESGGNASAVNPSSGAGGLVQFLPSTWASTPWGALYPGGAQTAPASVQLEAFQWEFARDGTAPWAPYDGC